MKMPPVFIFSAGVNYIVCGMGIWYGKSHKGTRAQKSKEKLSAERFVTNSRDPVPL
jgi:hypothetical protein